MKKNVNVFVPKTDVTALVKKPAAVINLEDLFRDEKGKDRDRKVKNLKCGEALKLAAKFAEEKQLQLITFKHKNPPLVQVLCSKEAPSRSLIQQVSTCREN